MENTLLALLLGVVEGLTEFLPVSSTGHLLLLEEVLGVSSANKTFEIVIQLGAILAVVVAYWPKLWGAVASAPRDPAARAFLRNILLGFAPAMVIGAVAYPLIRALLDSPKVIALALIIGGVVIIVLDRQARQARFAAIEAFPIPLSLKIGLCQCIAMIPGVSRSGATIIGALLVGVERKAATEFSFFLAIPTMVAATAFKLYKDWASLSFDNITMIAIGFITAFVAALIVVRPVVAFIGRHGFTPFGWYRIVIGTVMMIFLLAR